MKILIPIILLIAITNFVQLGDCRIRSRNEESSLNKDNTLNITSPTLWFSGQLLDHFDPIETRTWSQRYWISSNYFNPKNGSVILYLCGEWTCSGLDEMNGYSYTVMMAQAYNSLLVVLEHRFYGQSVPLGQSSLHLDSLQYLTIDQALADTAFFTQFIQNTGPYGLTKSHPWIIVGGSYAGAMSAWYRYKYPHLSIGAWASSGVVNAILQFWQFDWQVRDATEKSGDACPFAIQSISNYVELQLKSSITNQAIQDLFEADYLTDQEFLFFFTDQIAEAVQYGQRTALCNGLMNQSTSDQIQYVQSISTSPSGYSSRDLRIDITPVTSGSRQWNYQCCTEFGWWQTAMNNSFTLRSSQLNMNFYQEFCTDVFGSQYWPDVDSFNWLYGGTNLKVSNLIMTNGVEDPWRQASTSGISGNITNILIDCPDCGHCSDLRSPSSNDPQSLVKARETIKTLLGKWIHDYYNNVATWSPVEYDIELN